MKFLTWPQGMINSIYITKQRQMLEPLINVSWLPIDSSHLAHYNVKSAIFMHKSIISIMHDYALCVNTASGMPELYHVPAWLVVNQLAK